MDPRTPVIVGAAQVTRDAGEDGPIELALEALRLAAHDSGAGDALLRKADSCRHVATLCWPYSDEAALIASELGISPRETVRTTPLGGDGPQRLLGDTARAIAAGELEIALVTGAEALAALRGHQQAGARPDWPSQPSEQTPTRTVGTDRFASNEAEAAVGLLAPVYNYALLESAVRASKGEDRAIHERGIATLWSRFSKVAAANPHARIRQEFEPDELLAATPDNRPVSLPYLKRLTANIQVDQATALILCSAEAAAANGVRRDRWVFAHASAFASDEWFMTERAELASSPAIATAGSSALEHAGLTIDEVAYIDLYSCFPSAVQIAATELGVTSTDDRPLTLTGGLTFAGGPGQQLREPLGRDRRRKAPRRSRCVRADDRARVVRHQARGRDLLGPSPRAAVRRDRRQRADRPATRHAAPPRHTRARRRSRRTPSPTTATASPRRR